MTEISPPRRGSQSVSPDGILRCQILSADGSGPNDEQPTCWYAFLRECRRTTIGAAAQLADAIWEVAQNAKRFAKAVQQQPPAPEAPTASSAFQEPTTNP